MTKLELQASIIAITLVYIILRLLKNVLLFLIFVANSQVVPV